MTTHPSEPEPDELPDRLELLPTDAEILSSLVPKWPPNI
jgi:hypothetical protein